MKPPPTQSGKAARWLAPLAVGRLSTADALRSREESGPEAHVRSRMQLLGRARRKLLLVTASLPAWLTVRAFVRMVGWVLPSLGRAIASILPVAVPGYSRGAECAPEGARWVSVQLHQRCLKYFSGFITPHQALLSLTTPTSPLCTPSKPTNPHHPSLPRTKPAWL